MRGMPPLRHALAAATVLCATLAALAQPAPWYRWTSKVDGRSVCLQTTPGPGWDRSSGPYDNAACARRR